VIAEVGGGLRTYEVSNRPVLDGYGIDEMRTGGRGQPLLPWPNRIDGGRYQFGGRTHQLPLTEPARRNAIHGLTGWANWEVRAQADDRATLGLLVHPQDGYPFTLDLAIEYTLTDAGLCVTTTATNVGSTALPFGAGFHPYLTVGTPAVDDAVLELPASAVLESDERGIPTGRIAGVGDVGLDFRSPRPVGSTVLDHCFTDLGRDEQGVVRARLSTSDGAAAVTLWADAAFTHLMVFTGDTLEPAHRRRGLAVEPMTCAPNAFHTGDGITVLAPGQATTSMWGITPS
jgi:aldose 1-epimerase